MENQSFQQQNKELISKVRKNSNKKKKNFRWVSILWIFGVIAIAVLILFLVFNALKPIQHDPYSQTINVTLDSVDANKNKEELLKIKYPSDIVDYNLIIRNDLQIDNDIYLRFRPLTYVEGEPKSPNIIELYMNEENKENFFYDADNDIWYYLGKIAVGESVTICEKISVSSTKTGNEYANKNVNFYVSIEAIKVPKNNDEIVWSDESSIKWQNKMIEKGLLNSSEE